MSAPYRDTEDARRERVSQLLQAIRDAELRAAELARQVEALSRDQRQRLVPQTGAIRKRSFFRGMLAGFASAIVAVVLLVAWLNVEYVNRSWFFMEYMKNWMS